ncbi:MAG: 3-oxoacyl-ACP reductase FabG [Clostridia bacterium]|nr:3-oxoacyl-ACP reductase FabG [Clostridia bacterium]
MFELTDKKVLVTGSSRGIGREIAITFARQGAQVAVNYANNREEALKVAKEIEKLGKKSLCIKCDVSDEKAVKGMFDHIKREWGYIDILVNNAGTNINRDIFETSFEDWKKIMGINIDGTFLCSKQAMLIMKERNYGRIINISSLAAHQGTTNGSVHYGASKAGQIGFGKTLARTAAKYHITVNNIAPGLTATELLYQRPAGELDKLAEGIPLGIGKVSDIAAAAVFLASGEAGYITGQTLDVNGGWLMR